MATRVTRGPGSTNQDEFDNATTPNSKFHDGIAVQPGSARGRERPCAATMHVDVTTVGVASPPVGPGPSKRHVRERHHVSPWRVGEPPAKNTEQRHGPSPASPKPAGAGSRLGLVQTGPRRCPTGTATIPDDREQLRHGARFSTPGLAVDALTEDRWANDDQDGRGRVLHQQGHDARHGSVRRTGSRRTATPVTAAT